MQVRVGDGEVEVFSGETGAYSVFDTANTRLFKLIIIIIIIIIIINKN